jgi:hypothetical protein
MTVLVEHSLNPAEFLANMAFRNLDLTKFG